MARHEERLPPSWRARSRRRSYSASVELDAGWWLNAVYGRVSERDVLKEGAGSRTAAAQLGHWIGHFVVAVKTVIGLYGYHAM